MTPAEFEKWHYRISMLLLKDRQAEVDKLLLRLKKEGTPLRATDGKVVFIFPAPDEKISSVSLSGDMTAWLERRPLQKIPGTRLFFLEEHYEVNARLQYKFFINNQPYADVWNRCLSKSSFGDMSELIMPGYTCSKLYPSACERTDYYSLEGLKKHTLPAGALPYKHEIHVFQPDVARAQSSRNQKLISIYFNDGSDYVQEYAPMVLQKLVEAKRLPPCLGIFVTPPNLHEDKVPSRETEYGLNANYASFFCDELRPFIDENYDTARDAESRMVVGASFGGLVSVWIGLLRPDLFHGVLSQSGYFSFQNFRILDEIRHIGTPKNRIFFHVGTYEKRVGATSLPRDEQNFTEANIEMKKLLEELDVDYDFHISHEAHNWGTWMVRLAAGLEWLCS